MAATRTQLSQAYPIGAHVDEDGRLQLGGCDAVELAREFGTPSYVVVEDDLRARAQTFVEAFRARTTNFDVLFASKAFPCTAVYRVLAHEGISCDVASGGELALALRGGFDPSRIYMHGNAKSLDELRLGPSVGRRAHRGRQRRRGRAPGGGRRRRAGAARAAARHAGRARRDERQDLDGSGGLEVRVLDGRRARRDRACAGQRSAGSRRPARPHRLADPRARSVSPRDRGARAARRLRYVQPRRGTRRGLHGRPAATADRRIRRGEGRHGASRPGSREAHPRRARSRARRQLDRDALHGPERQAQRLDVGRRRRRDVRQPAADALWIGVRGAGRRSLRRRHHRATDGQALRVRRRDRARGAAQRSARR